MNYRKVKFFLIMVFVTALLDLLPSIGFITVGDVSVTTMQLPTILTSILLGPLCGLLIGGLFGTISMFRAMSREAATLDILFQNPLVSILPRLCIALVAGWVYRLLDRALKGRARALSMEAAAVLGSLTNTILVFSALYLVYPKELVQLFDVPSTVELRGLLLESIQFNGVIEAVVSMVIIAILATAIQSLWARWDRNEEEPSITRILSE